MGLASCVLNTSCSKECDPDEVHLFSNPTVKEIAKDSTMVYTYHHFNLRRRDTITLNLGLDDTLFIETNIEGQDCKQLREAHVVSHFGGRISIQSYLMESDNTSSPYYLALNVNYDYTWSIVKPAPYVPEYSTEGLHFIADDGSQIRFKTDSGLVWLKNYKCEIKRIQ